MELLGGIITAVVEVVAKLVLESILFSIPVRIYEWITGKSSRIGGYRTYSRKYIKFSAAKKLFVAWETEIEHLKFRLKEGLDTINDPLNAEQFRFEVLNDKTVITPSSSISFFTFHALIQWLDQHKIQNAGIVETVRTTYSVYNDPESENLIGETAKGEKFFISLQEDHDKRQLLRVNPDLRTIEMYRVERIKEALSSNLAGAANSE